MNTLPSDLPETTTACLLLSSIIRSFFFFNSQSVTILEKALKDSLTLQVMPSLREKHDEFMLRELVKRWENHKVMVRWLSRFFYYLDRYFIVRRSLPPLNEVGLTCFRDLVCQCFSSFKNDVLFSHLVLCLSLFSYFVKFIRSWTLSDIPRNEGESYRCCNIIGMLWKIFYVLATWLYLFLHWFLNQIDREREGEQIDRALLKNVLDIFVEIGLGQMECYENDFEAAMLDDTASYYSRKATRWITEDSCPEYMLKVYSFHFSFGCIYCFVHSHMLVVYLHQAEECLKREKDRVSHYLHSSSEQKLLEVLFVPPLFFFWTVLFSPFLFSIWGSSVPLNS